MSGGTDISFMRDLRVPCAIALGIFLVLTVLVVGSCVRWITSPDGSAQDSARGGIPSAAALAG